MLPTSFRLWENDKMLYPMNFSVSVNPRNGYKGLFSVKYERNEFSASIAMQMTPFMAVNGPVYEEDIVTNGTFTGIVSFCLEKGAYIVTALGSDEQKALVELGKIKVLGNRYENPEIPSDYIIENKNPGKPTEHEEPSSVEAATFSDDNNDEETSQLNDELSEETQYSSDVDPEPEIDMNDDDDEIYASAEEEPEESDNEEISTAVPEEETIDEPEYEDDISSTETEPDNSIEESYHSELYEDYEDDDEDEEESYELPEVISPKQIHIYLAFYMQENKKKGVFNGSYAYTVFVDDEIYTQGEKYIPSTDKIKLCIDGMIDVLNKVSFNGMFKITCNSKALLKPFTNDLISRWHEDNWVKGNGAPLSYKDEWSYLYELVSKKENIKWELQPSPIETSELGEQILRAKDVYYAGDLLK